MLRWIFIDNAYTHRDSPRKYIINKNRDTHTYWRAIVFWSTLCAWRFECMFENADFIVFFFRCDSFLFFRLFLHIFFAKLLFIDIMADLLNSEKKSLDSQGEIMYDRPHHDISNGKIRSCCSVCAGACWLICAQSIENLCQKVCRICLLLGVAKIVNDVQKM